MATATITFPALMEPFDHYSLPILLKEQVGWLIGV